MSRRTLAGVALVVAAMQANWASALSLGELSTDSALNQPFRAEVPVRDAADLNASQVVIKLASVEDFENAGVEYSYLLSKLKFAVQLDGDGTGKVVITTEEPVVEPYLDFIVEARWPSGRVLREYTVLLDLPVIGEARAGAIEAAEGGAVFQAVQQQPETVRQPETVIETVPEPAATGPQPRVGAERTQLPAAEGGDQYRVQHADTLWEIAERVRPSENVTVHQTMLALLRNNPEAFQERNVNRLKSGYVLRLPSEAEAQAVSQGEAVEEIQRQNRAWRGMPATDAGVAATEEGPQLKATDEAPVTETAPAETESRLTIATPGESTTEGGAEGGASNEALIAAQEGLDRAQRENEEMQSRVADLERQLATLQRLLELKDEQLNALQSGATEQQRAAQTPQPEPQDTGEIFGFSRQMLINAGIGVAVLLLLVLLMRYQKRKQEADRQQEFSAAERLARVEPGLDEEDVTKPSAPGAVAAAAAAAASTAAPMTPEREQEADEFFSDQDEGLEDIFASAQAEAEGEAPVEAETGDPVAEADIYVAYGRYDQAAELLKSAIAKEPGRSELRIKLLELYLDTRDQDRFMAEFEALQATGDDDAIAKVKESMTAIEGVSDWLRDDSTVVPRPAAPAPAPAAEESFDTGFDLGAEESFEEPESPKAEQDESFDFDLSLDSLEDDLELDTSGETGSDALLDLDMGEEEKGEAEKTDLELDEGFELEGAGIGELPELDSDLDFDLDLSEELGEEPGLAVEEEPEAPAPVREEPTPAEPAPAVPAQDIVFDEFTAREAAEGDEDFDLLGESDEVGTKLDLARAYIDMGDTEGAREMLQEVMQEGNDDQKQEAGSLLERL